MALAFWRAALVALVLLPLLLLVKPQWARLRREQVVFYALYGLLLALFNSLWTLSVALNGASVATILTYCSVGFTVFLGWVMYSERLTLRQLLVIAISLGGCFLVSNCDSIRPPATHRPSGRRDSAPAPLPKAMGNVPISAAMVVIMMGRKRTTAAS